MAIFQRQMRAQDSVNVLIGKNCLVALEKRLLKVVGLVWNEAGRRGRRRGCHSLFVAADGEQDKQRKYE
jgi:hypothetical protein